MAVAQQYTITCTVPAGDTSCTTVVQVDSFSPFDLTMEDAGLLSLAIGMVWVVGWFFGFIGRYLAERDESAKGD